MNCNQYPKDVPHDILPFVQEIWQNGLFGPRADKALQYLVSKWGTWVSVDDVADAVYSEEEVLDSYRSTMRMLNDLQKNLVNYFDKNGETLHVIRLVFPKDVVKEMDKFSSEFIEALGNAAKCVGAFLQYREDQPEIKVTAESTLERFGNEYLTRWPDLPLEIEKGYHSESRLGLPIEKVHLYWDGAEYELPESIDCEMKQFLWQLQQMRSPFADQHEGTLFRLNKPLTEHNAWYDHSSGIHALGSVVNYSDVVSTNRALPLVWDKLKGAKWSDRIEQCANPLALNVMLTICTDNRKEFFVANLRGNRNAENPECFGPSLSGSIDKLIWESDYLDSLDSLSSEARSFILTKMPDATPDNIRRVNLRKVIVKMALDELGRTVADALKTADIYFTSYGRGLSRGYDALLLKARLKLSQYEVDESLKERSNRIETRGAFFIPFDEEHIQSFLKREIPTREDSGIDDISNMRRLPFVAFQLIDWFENERRIKNPGKV